MYPTNSKSSIQTYTIDKESFFSNLIEFPSENEITLSVQDAMKFWRIIWSNNAQSIDFNSFSLNELEKTLDSVMVIRTEVDDAEGFQRENAANPMVQAFLLDGLQDKLANLRVKKRSKNQFL
ncbi:hypothetical protein AB3N04_01095 (plasmid) [Alkalihalophilus sp. As8PL]|uniref:Uncharacterized protein n=1 Tax=Alkalihalophilus sp. As8PL TaxID=3237103 RepID=A0AB39BMQ5_9BACI